MTVCDEFHHFKTAAYIFGHRAVNELPITRSQTQNPEECRS